MTVIAYRDGVLAGDSACSDPNMGAVAYFQNKLTKFPSGALYGSSGEADDRALKEILARVRRKEDFPTREELRQIKEEVDAILVLPNGEVYIVGTGKKGCGVERLPDNQFMAIGSGAVLAIGAMEFGASAEQAAAVAARRDMACREPIHSMRLDDDQEPSSRVRFKRRAD